MIGDFSYADKPIVLALHKLGRTCVKTTANFFLFSESSVGTSTGIMSCFSLSLRM